MKSKHLFFDLDRTLWDFEKNSEIALNKLFFDLGLHSTIPNFTVFHELYKTHNSRLWKLYGSGKLSKDILRNERFRVTLEEFNLVDPLLVQNISDGYVEISPQQTTLFPTTISTLDVLQKEGFNMHIITNGFAEVQYKKLTNSGIGNYFKTITNSEMAGVKKPNPKIFKFALSLAKANLENSIMIGDCIDADVKGAMNFGMEAILFNQSNVKIPENIKQINHLLELKKYL
jgi:YjjG family noncanonical pyrimidine nucleotidase